MKPAVKNVDHLKKVTNFSVVSNYLISNTQEYN